MYKYNPILEFNTENGIPRKKKPAAKKQLKKIDAIKHDLKKC